tara:strand:- start:1356 stop:2690 length:1335 start_codon:yes stop_codon:yes gene_type:complete
MIEISGTIHFKKFKSNKQMYSFIKGINIIYGESGSGKSLLLDFLQGKDIKKKDLNFYIEMDKCGLQTYRVYQNPDHQIIASTIGNEITFSGECIQLEPNELKNILDNGLEFLPEYINPDMNPGYLSGGEKEQLNLITALQSNREVILIDDGLSFLSDENKKDYVNTIRECAEKSNAIIIWATSLKEDLEYGDAKWEMTLNSLNQITTFIPSKYDNIIIPKGLLCLSIEGLVFKYQNSRNIFNNYSLKISNVRSLGLVGDNGSGKTTLAGLLFYDLEPSDGKVNVSVDIDYKPTIGYVDQFPENLILLKTVNEFFIDLKNNEIFDEDLDNTFKKCLKRFGIQWEQIEDKKAIDLPWALLRIFLIVLFTHCRFKILILDEPTFGLGWNQKKKLRLYLSECMRHYHMIIVSHDRDFIINTCDQVVDLDTKNYEKVNFESEKKINVQR